jgi:hypothetical protein
MFYDKVLGHEEESRHILSHKAYDLCLPLKNVVGINRLKEDALGHF